MIIHLKFRGRGNHHVIYRALVHHVIKPPIGTSRDTRVFGAISNSRMSEEEDHALLLRLVRWLWLLVAA